MTAIYLCFVQMIPTRLMLLSYLNIAKNNLTGQIPEFLEKNETFEDLDLFGGCSTFPNFISKFIRKIRQNGQKTPSNNILSTLSLCKCCHPIYVLIFFFESFII